MKARRTAFLKKRPVIFSLLGGLYLGFGVISFLKLGATWHFQGAFVWGPLAYAGINLLIAYGFFSMHQWLLPVLTLNWVANALVILVKLLVHTAEPSALLSYGLAMALNTVVLAAVYLSREKLRDSQEASYFGAAFIALWLGMFCYNTISAFT